MSPYQYKIHIYIYIDINLLDYIALLLISDSPLFPYGEEVGDLEVTSISSPTKERVSPYLFIDRGIPLSSGIHHNTIYVRLLIYFLPPHLLSMIHPPHLLSMTAPPYLCLFLLITYSSFYSFIFLLSSCSLLLFTFFLLPTLLIFLSSSLTIHSFLLAISLIYIPCYFLYPLYPS